MVVAVTMRDVAAHAGVSQRTVSNVVSGAVPVAESTRARVEASIRALGYRTFAPARQLRQGRTSTVALALPRLTEPYFAELAQCVIDRARAQGLRVVVVTTESERDAELAILRGDQVFADGVIMSPVALTPADESLRHPLFPAVLIGDRGLGAAVAHVGPDNRGAVAAALGHLIALGRRRIALLGSGAGPSQTCEHRTAGYLDALATAGLSVDPELLWTSDWNFDQGRAVTAAALTAGVGFDAIFAMNDSAARGALKALQQAGVAVPQQVAVAGFDHTGAGAQQEPGLTTVGPSPDQVARIALERLVGQFDGAAAAGQSVIDHELIIRRSTDATAAD